VAGCSRRHPHSKWWTGHRRLLLTPSQRRPKAVPRL